MAFLAGTDLNSVFTGNHQIPLYVFCLYQMMFAIITPALITGAFTNRVRFPAYLMFLTAWLVFLYFPLVHMVWGGGMLAQWGVLDFAGGIVVHASAGMAALASVFMLEKEILQNADRTAFLLLLLEPVCCGSDGMDLMREVNYRLMQLRDLHF